MREGQKEGRRGREREKERGREEGQGGREGEGKRERGEGREGGREGGRRNMTGHSLGWHGYLTQERHSHNRSSTHYIYCALTLVLYQMAGWGRMRQDGANAHAVTLSSKVTCASACVCFTGNPSTMGRHLLMSQKFPIHNHPTLL